ncbi:MAG: ABC-F family ATP-binding cassette domain-containing protein [Rickettsiales bacterium]
MDAILTLHNAYLAYADKVIFEDLSLNIHKNSKICLIGKNGAGKTSLMNILTGSIELDQGERWVQAGLKIGYLKQNIELNAGQTIYEFIFSALAKEKQNEEYSYVIEMIANPLELDLNSLMTDLSGGQLRRAALAYALVEDPDLLLLDEPTNHLDLEAIKWLEDYLLAYRGSFICISHDKRFLENISSKVFWLDRGNIKICPEGFKKFPEWSNLLLEQEKRELENRQRNLNIEVEWANRGVKARRKRNIRRLEEMKQEREALKEDKSSFLQATKTIALAKVKTGETSKIQGEFIKVNKFFIKNKQELAILKNFNLRIMSKDRFGIIGKNGSGKSSFLKLLIGELTTDSGKIKLGKNVTISYFSQNRNELDQNKTLLEIMCPNGGEYIEAAGKTRHICGYLKDFMFAPQLIYNKAKTLSGGQQNRLILAKILAKPGSFLILDEPTNDLDMETLELLEDILANYNGTLFIVSHDRDFLDNTVNKIIAFSGNGVVETYIGGYSDYIKAAKKQEDESKIIKQHSKNKQPELAKKAKLSYHLKYELEQLPKKINKLEQLIKSQQEQLDKLQIGQIYDEEYNNLTIDLAKNQFELDNLETRWLELSEL